MHLLLFVYMSVYYAQSFVMLFLTPDFVLQHLNFAMLRQIQIKFCLTTLKMRMMEKIFAQVAAIFFLINLIEFLK